MPEESKTAGDAGENELDRRRFFIKVGMTSVAVAAAGTAVFAYQFLSPTVLYEPSPIVNAGKPEQYAPDSVTLDPENQIYVVRDPQGFLALSAICTHLGCLTAYNPELGIIACPCHGSKFTRDGIKTAGPAPKPLPMLRMWLNDDGELMVDRSVTMTSKQLVRV